MGFKANIDIALSFSTLKICSVRQQGRIKFRICLYYTFPNGKKQKVQHQELNYCHPYSILRKNIENKHHTNSQKKISTLKNNPTTDKYLSNYFQMHFPNEESELDLGSDYYLSKPFKVMFEREVHSIMETCCFRTYIDIQKYSDLDLRCQVQLMFSPNSMTQQAPIFKTIAKCDCKIRKIFDISTYLPIVFDQFEGVVIEGVYQAALIDFRYQRDPNEMNPKINPENFYEYLKVISNGFNRVEVRNFYRYYRQILQKQLFSIQERHYDLLRVLGINSSMDEFRILKVNFNTKVQLMIDHLGGFNSHQNPYQYNNKKSLQHISDNVQQEDQRSYTLNKSLVSKGSQQIFRSYSSSQSYKQQISEQIIFDFLAVKAHIFKKWSDYLEFTTKHITAVAERYKNNYSSMVKQRLSGNVFSHKVNSTDWKKSVYEDSGRQHLKLAEADRKKVQKDEQLWKQMFLIESEGFFGKDSKNIKIFQQVYTVTHKSSNTKSQKLLLRKSLERNSSFFNYIHQFPTKKQNKETSFQSHERKNSFPIRPNQPKIQQSKSQLPLSTVSTQVDDEDHFIVLVHGFQASRQDFFLLKNCLEIKFKAKVFISTCNQGRTDDDIQIQGKRLALQLQKYLNDSNPSFRYKLSFVGHSMGGIIVRTALCYLENVGDHLYSYISFSTPHLGYLYEPSTHIQAGLWLMGAIQKTNSIQQICVRDKQEIRQSFLYKLSRSRTLNKFKQIALVGSSQDKYVPYESSRVEQNQQLINQNLNSQTGQIVYEMIDGIIGSIQCRQLSRIDVIFNIEQKNFDSMIGRTAHIKYLSDRQFIKVFCIVFDKFFK